MALFTRFIHIHISLPTTPLQYTAARLSALQTTQRHYKKTHTQTHPVFFWGKISPVACYEQHSKAAVPLELEHHRLLRLPALPAAITSCAN